jgi:hypothetical protein
MSCHTAVSTTYQIKTQILFDQLKHQKILSGTQEPERNLDLEASFSKMLLKLETSHKIKQKQFK